MYFFLSPPIQSPAGWSSLEDDLPDIRERLGDLHYVFPPAPTIGLTINGGMSEFHLLLRFVEQSSRKSD